MIRQVQTDKRFFKHMETYKLIALQYMRNKPILLIGGKCQALYKEKIKQLEINFTINVTEPLYNFIV